MQATSGNDNIVKINDAFNILKGVVLWLFISIILLTQMIFRFRVPFINC
jgi:hypothetical protein